MPVTTRPRRLIIAGALTGTALVGLGTSGSAFAVPGAVAGAGLHILHLDGVGSRPTEATPEPTTTVEVTTTVVHTEPTKPATTVPHSEPTKPPTPPAAATTEPVHGEPPHSEPATSSSEHPPTTVHHSEPPKPATSSHQETAFPATYQLSCEKVVGARTLVRCHWTGTAPDGAVRLQMGRSNGTLGRIVWTTEDLTTVSMVDETPEDHPMSYILFVQDAAGKVIAHSQTVQV